MVVPAFKKLKETIKHDTAIGAALHDIYLRVRYNEGEILEISGGPLRGKKWVRFMRSHHDGYAAGSHEPAVQAALQEHLKPGMTFYDVGANAGFFTLLGSTMVGPSGHVVSFEPHPKTASQLRRQISVNQLQNVDIVEAAICDQVGTAEFTDDTSSDVASLVTLGSGRRTITVKTETLDSITERYPQPNVLKIDVEGAEIAALEGARRLIEQLSPTLLVELHSREITRQYHLLMAEYGYETTAVDGRKLTEGKSARFVLSKRAS